jgi:phage replication-related protein YjqB (UPF0714/DUF867 family)
MDVYENFAELKQKENEGDDFFIFIFKKEESSTVIASPHGGAIEPGTSEVAKEIAKNDLSLAIFEGRKSSDNARLHITSTNFDEPRCMELIQEANNVIAIHGECSEEKVVFFGGLDQKLGEHLKEALTRYRYKVKTHENSNLQGISAANICNRGRRGVGVQLELSLGLRLTFFDSLTAKGRNKPTNELNKFATAIREGLHAAGAL